MTEQTENDQLFKTYKMIKTIYDSEFYPDIIIGIKSCDTNIVNGIANYLRYVCFKNVKTIFVKSICTIENDTVDLNILNNIYKEIDSKESKILLVGNEYSKSFKCYLREHFLDKVIVKTCYCKLKLKTKKCSINKINGHYKHKKSASWLY